MKTLKLRDDFYWAGIVDDTLRVFDIIMYTEFGTTYNSYVLKSGGKTVLFETVKEAFFEEWMDKLGEVIDVTKIDYLVVNHTEPDHAGSVQRLLKLSPQLKIISTACAAGFLKEIVNSEFCNLIVHDNETMKIGDKTLRFLLVPNLHWPDTMYTFIEEEQVLVTCDSFGSHYGFQDVLVSKVTDREGYMRATKYYFDCIIGPFKPFMLKALERVRELDVSMICPGHGPVLDSGIDFIEDTYEAGIALAGTEVKSLRAGKCSIKESFIRVEKGEVYIYGMHISPYEKGNIFNKDPMRVRKLLLHRHEINKIEGSLQEKGLTLVPLKVYFKNSLVKLEIGVARGKKLYDKRQDIAKKDQRREAEREFKVKNL